MDIHNIKKEQWNKFHKINKYVTNSSINEIFGYHQLEIPTNKLVLDIGVGRGDFIKNLSKYNTMIGVDVSQDALEVVKPFCKDTCLSEKLNELEGVDLAMCHLVMQHNHEYEVTRIINDVNINHDGIFSFQFASLNPNKTILSELIMNDVNNSMLYFYSQKKMESIVGNTNKKLINVIGPIWFAAPYNFEWFIFRVINR